MNQQLKSRIRAIEYYYKNRDKVLASLKVKSNIPENKDKKRIYDKNYRILNKDRISLRLNNWYNQHKQIAKDRAKIWKQKNPERAQYQRYLERAKAKDSSFGLNFDEFVEIIKMPCIYCGFNEGIVGIDRIDSNKGYEKNNIISCCKVCNYMKLDHSLEDWLTAMSDIFHNLGYDITPSTKNNSGEQSKI